jgi:hypothetical protein
MVDQITFSGCLVDSGKDNIYRTADRPNRVRYGWLGCKRYDIADLSIGIFKARSL